MHYSCNVQQPLDPDLRVAGSVSVRVSTNVARATTRIRNFR